MKKLIVSLMIICALGLTACSGTTSKEVGNNDEVTSASETVLGNNNDSTKESKTEEVKQESTYDDKALDIAVSYANWTDVKDIYVSALNLDKMMMSDVPHLPIYKFDTLADLEQFKMDFGDRLTMDHGYDEIPAFNDVTAKYDEKFFSDNSLMLVYVEASSGSDRYGVNSVYCTDGKFCIRVECINSPDLGTCDMAGWFITVAVSDSVIEDCNEFDAFF